jgi:hypothetical protein
MQGGSELCRQPTGRQSASICDSGFLLSVDLADQGRRKIVLDDPARGEPALHWRRLANAERPVIAMNSDPGAALRRLVLRRPFSNLRIAFWWGFTVLALKYLYSAHVVAAPLASGGTLVLMVHSKEGLIVAADRRTVVHNTACDYQVKILIPTRPDRTIATVTGNGIDVKSPGPEITDICRYIRSAPRLLDIETIVTQYVERSNADIETLQLEELAQRCVDGVRDFQVTWPLALSRFAGHELFQVVLANYNPNFKSARIRSFLVGLSTVLEPHYARITNREVSSQARRDVVAAGETDYLNQFVYNGFGRRFLSQETINFLSEQGSVARTSRRDAVAVSIDIIEAASKTTALIPAERPWRTNRHCTSGG